MERENGAGHTFAHCFGTCATGRVHGTPWCSVLVVLTRLPLLLLLLLLLLSAVVVSVLLAALRLPKEHDARTARPRRVVAVAGGGEERRSPTRNDRSAGVATRKKKKKRKKTKDKDRVRQDQRPLLRLCRSFLRRRNRGARRFPSLLTVVKGCQASKSHAPLLPGTLGPAREAKPSGGTLDATLGEGSFPLSPLKSAFPPPRLMLPSNPDGHSQSPFPSAIPAKPLLAGLRQTLVRSGPKAGFK